MSDMVLKVPEGSSIGITPELWDFIEENGRIELFGEASIPGRGTVEGGDG